MTQRIGHLLPGEELTDPESFFALHSTLPTAPEGTARGVSPPRAPELPEISARPQRHLASAAPFTPSRREEPIGGPHSRLSFPASPAAAAALEAEIDCCTSREHVVRLAVHLACAYSTATVLFVVHRGLIERICSHGLASCGEGLLFPADAPSLFGEVVASGEPFRGAPPQDALDGRILRALGRQHVQEMTLLPVVIRSRVVNLLYADNGPQALGDASVAALAAVCARLSGAYERLILERKRESAPRPCRHSLGASDETEAGIALKVEISGGLDL